NWSSGGAEGGPKNGKDVSYSTLKSWLANNENSPYDVTAFNSLPASNTAFPNSTNSFYVATAQQKALGTFSGNGSALDGATGFGLNSRSSFWEEAALHEIAHAMGRVSIANDSGSTNATIMDLFRNNAPGQYQ